MTPKQQPSRSTLLKSWPIMVVPWRNWAQNEGPNENYSLALPLTAIKATASPVVCMAIVRWKKLSLSSFHPTNGWLIHSFPTIQPRPKSSLPAQGAIHPNHHCHCPRKSNLLPEHPDNWNLEPQKPNHDTTILHSNITPVDKLHLQWAELNGANESTTKHPSNIQHHQQHAIAALATKRLRQQRMIDLPTCCIIINIQLY